MRCRNILRILCVLLGTGVSLEAEVLPATWLQAPSSANVGLGASPDNLLDGSGLDDPSQAEAGASLDDLQGLRHSFDTGVNESWVTRPSLPDYFASNPALVIVFDLGRDAWLSSIVLWQYQNHGGGGGHSGNAARTIDVRVALSEDGPNFSGSALTTLNVANVHTDLGGKNKAQTFSLGAGVRARYLQFRVTDNYFGQPGILAGGERVGLGEVRFNVSNGGARTVYGSAPVNFQMRAATIADPNMQSVLNNVNPWGLALDPEEDRVFWSDPISGVIGWVGYGSRAGEEDHLVTAPGAVLHGMDYDCFRKLLYVLDSAGDRIIEVNVNNNSRRNLTPKTFVRPNAIDHHPVTRRLVVSDSGNDRLYVFSHDGTQLATFASSDTVGVWGVAFDPSSNRIYFTSHDLGTVTTWNPFNNKLVLVAKQLDGPRGIEIDREGRIFVLESGKGRIVEVNPTNGTFTPTDHESVIGGRDFVLFHADDADGDLLLDWWEEKEGASLCRLGPFGNTKDFDGRTPFFEMLFNGTTDGFDASGVQTVTSDPDGSNNRITFDTLSDPTYAYTLQVSEDLQNWQDSVASPSLVSLGDGRYQRRVYKLNAVAEGLTGDQIYARLVGSFVGGQ